MTTLPPADAALLPYDLWVNKAHSVMLAKTGIIPSADAAKILRGLMAIEKQIASGDRTLDTAYEDVHTQIESQLTDALGIDVAGKLHTARSRNDQVVTDMKLYLRDQVILLTGYSIGLVQTLLALADAHKQKPFPGFTHHQHAMVTSFGHILAGFASMIIRDIKRLEHWSTLHNTSPLGNAASYGTSFPIDRYLTSTLLGFDGPDRNSLDAITNRWEPEADLAFGISVLMQHLSTVAETLMLLATPEFGMITLSDEYSTGSSIMPQKKNPDPLEVIKGKAAFSQGQLMSLLSLGKGSFIGYNRDSQWAKYIIMDIFRECSPSPAVLSGVLETMTIHHDVMEKWCTKSFIGATTLMEQLAATAGLPMRRAKIVVEKAVKYSAGKNSVSYRAMHKALKECNCDVTLSATEVKKWQDPQTILSLAKSTGGPGSKQIAMSLKYMHRMLKKQRAWFYAQQKRKQDALMALNSEVQHILKGGE
jgi:argininosuccinate lyase